MLSRGLLVRDIEDAFKDESGWLTARTFRPTFLGGAEVLDAMRQVSPICRGDL
jgi:hypothetical protein